VALQPLVATIKIWNSLLSIQTSTAIDGGQITLHSCIPCLFKSSFCDNNIEWELVNWLSAAGVEEL